jgi:hypothetical protein
MRLQYRGSGEMNLEFGVGVGVGGGYFEHLRL